MRRRCLGIPVVLALLALAAIAVARPGGGETFGGGDSSSGSGSSGPSGGGGDDGAGAIFQILIWLAIEHPTVGVPLLIVAGLAYFFFHKSDSLAAGWSTRSPGAVVLRERMERAGRELDRSRLRSEHQSRLRAGLEALTKVDPAFSVIVFEDFLHALFVEAHTARGAGTLDRLAPWLSAAARDKLAAGSARRVEAIVIGAIRYRELRGLDDGSPRIGVSVEIEANYTETTDSATSYWVVERWSLSRAKSAKSRPPKRARVFECPSCGAPFDRIVGARCEYCQTVVDTGDYDWVVDEIESVERRARAPALTGTTEERGTELATVLDPHAEERFQALEARDPEMRWPALEARVRLVFDVLTRAYNAQDLSPARPYLGDLLFETLGYWIDAYRKAGLANVNQDAKIAKLVIARVTTDAHYDAITIRVFATGFDYTLDAEGRVVAGSRGNARRYSEYWTLVRGVTVRGAPRSQPICPSCGAPADVNQAGACNHCRAEVTSGDFDWVLTRIEQDEAY